MVSVDLTSTMLTHCTPGAMASDSEAFGVVVVSSVFKPMEALLANETSLRLKY